MKHVLGYVQRVLRPQIHRSSPTIALPSTPSPNTLGGDPQTEPKAASAPVMKQTLPTLHRFLYGEVPSSTTLHEWHARQAQLRLDTWITQEQMTENDRGYPSANRYSRLAKSEKNTTHHKHSSTSSAGPEAGYHLVRYDKLPLEAWHHKIKNDDASRGDSVILKVWRKAALDEVKGKLRSSMGDFDPIFGALPGPDVMANLIFWHVFGKNKLWESLTLAAPLSEEEAASYTQDLRQRIVDNFKREGLGSPFISATVNPPMGNKLQEWGVAGEYIEIDADAVNVITPTQAVGLVLYRANDAALSEPAKCNWRQMDRYFEEPYGEAANQFAAVLTQHGINPEGPWTVRERAAFFILVTDEHFIIGETPEGAARIVRPDPTTGHQEKVSATQASPPADTRTQPPKQ